MDCHYYYHVNHDGVSILVLFFVILPIFGLGFYFFYRRLSR